MVGVSGPSPEQGDRRRECAGSLCGNGCNVLTLAPGGWHRLVIVPPSQFSTLVEQEGLGKAERPALGGVQRL